jgi:hypothetical protein
MLELNYVISTGPQVSINSFPANVQSATITTEGFPVQIICTGDASPLGGSTYQRLQIYRDSTPIGNVLHIESVGSGINTTVAQTWIDNPPAGTHTYYLVAIAGSGGGFQYGEVSPVTITLEEKKYIYDMNSSLNNLPWLRRDVASSDTVYYGYSVDANAQDSDNSWTIKKVYTSGTVESVTWTNGTPNLEISIWANRVSSFVSPTYSISLTWSVVPTYYTADSDINLSWNTIPGVDVYQVSVKDSKGNLLSNDGYILNINQNEDENPITSEIHATSGVTTHYTYKHGKVGMTYSINVLGKNVAGSTSSSVFVGV